MNIKKALINSGLLMLLFKKKYNYFNSNAPKSGATPK